MSQSIVALLFIVGYKWTKYTNSNRWFAGFGLLLLGFVLVAIYSDEQVMSSGRKDRKRLWSAQVLINLVDFLLRRPPVQLAVQQQSWALNRSGIIDWIVGEAIETMLNAAPKHSQFCQRKRR